MILETIFGGLFGGLFRLAPELLKFFDRNNERKHEVQMFDLQIKSDELRAKTEEVKAESAINVAELQGIIEATRAQSQITGVKWVDAINALIRPVITIWWVIVLYTAALIAKFLYIREQGASYVQSVLEIWGPSEQAIVACIISFWFVDRSLRKGGSR